MSSVSCSICWEIVTSSCVVSNLSCGHVYHQACVEKWMGMSKTCPECRNRVNSHKRIYLNLVPDPQIENLNSELFKQNEEIKFTKLDNDIQNAIIKQLENEMNTKLSEKDKELQLSKITNDELLSNISSVEQRSDKLKLELEMQEKKNENLTNELTNLKNQLAASLIENIEITHLINALKESNHEQISGLHSDIHNLNERLDLFRNEFVNANNKLQAQILENEIIKTERDSLLRRNSQLVRNIYVRKKRRAVYSRKLKNITNLRKHKIKRTLLPCEMISSKSDGILKIKLVKSKLTWKCVKLK